MLKYGFSLIRIFPYKYNNSVLIRENKGKRKPVFWYILGIAWPLAVKYMNVLR